MIDAELLQLIFRPHVLFLKLELLGIQLESSPTFDKVSELERCDEDRMSANPLFQRCFRCRRRPWILKFARDVTAAMLEVKNKRISLLSWELSSIFM